MLCVIPFCARDAWATLNLLAWMRELGEMKKHQALLVSDHGINTELLNKIHGAASSIFNRTELSQLSRCNPHGWPRACNGMFSHALYVVNKRFKCPFWWNEPDCIPLRAGWLDLLEEEYLHCGKPFMGHIAEKPFKHLTGCALYPANATSFNPFFTKNNPIAWDAITPEKVLPYSHHTELFQHLWVRPDGQLATFSDDLSLAVVSPKAVVLHRNKDHTLIERLREKEARYHRIRGGCAIKREPAPIYTYYKKCGNETIHKKLMDLWMHLWQKQGWDPVVLGEEDAWLDEKSCAELLSAVNKLPTQNHREYENACYLRHLAMANKGGGLLVDYDVMPVSYEPSSENIGLVILEPTKVPCAVRGSAEGFRQIVQMFLHYRPGAGDIYRFRPHVSDMTILRQSSFPSSNHCLEYLCSGRPVPNDPGDGWKQARMIHFSSASLGLRRRDARDKAEIIREVLAELKTSRPESKPA